MLKFEKRINYLLHLKYKTNERKYNQNIIDSIIFNERSHFVTNYKEFLISEDEYEFLKRYYNTIESNIRLKKFINYYSKCSILFPNYSALSEAEIIYKNINLKQKVIDDIHKSNKNNNKIENENLDSNVFNSKVYDSIINNSENCLSIFSYDKESINNENKDDEINELIKYFDKIEKTKNNDKQIKNNLSIEVNYINNTNSNNTVYTRKKTPNHSINKKNINNSSSRKITKNLKNQYKNNNKEENKTNNESRNILQGCKTNQIYKKINLNLLDYSGKKSNRSSDSFKIVSRENSLLTAFKSSKSTKKNSMNLISLKEDNNERIQKLNKINDIPMQINSLTEKINVTPIKVNIKKLENKRYNFKFRNKEKNKDSHSKPKEKSIINVNKSNEFTYKEKTSYSFYNRNDKIGLTDRNIDNKSINNANINNLNTIFNLRNVNKGININKSNKSKGKINILKNKDKYAQQFNYIINNYNNKSTTYNTTIEFNNNIKLIDSNSHRSNFIKNIYENSTFNQSSNISDFIQRTPYEKKIISENKSYNVLKKYKNKNNNILDFLLNNKNYFSSINDNKRKNFFSKEILNSIEKNHSKGKMPIKQPISIFNPTSEGVSTPFNIRQNNSIFSKLNVKICKNSVVKKNKTISNESIKSQKNSSKKKDKKIKEDNIKNSILKKKNLNITNISISNINNEKSHSFLTSKIDSNSNTYQNFCKLKKEKIDNKNNFMNKIKKDKNHTFCLNSNNINENVQKKINKKKNNNIKEFNKDRKMKKIINESNEQINQYKLEFLKKFKQI